MAVDATLLTVGGSSTDAQSYDTASITPTGNKLILAVVENRSLSQSALTAIPTLSGNGITWVQVVTVTSGNDLARLTLFRGMVASPSAGAVTITIGGAGNIYCGWVISEHAGIDTTGTNGSGAIGNTASNSDTGTNTGLTVTLAAFGSVNNATYGAFRTEDTSVAKIVPGSGFTEIGEWGGDNGAGDIEAEFKATNDTSVDASWASTDSVAEGVAAEIVASTASPSASPSATPSVSISATPSASVSSSMSASPSFTGSPSASPSASISSSVSATPSPSSSLSSSESSSLSASVSSSVSASPSVSVSASISASVSATPSSSISSSISSSPSSSISASPSSSYSSSVSSSPSSSPSASPSMAQYEDLYEVKGTVYTDKYREF